MRGNAVVVGWLRRLWLLEDVPGPLESPRGRRMLRLVPLVGSAGVVGAQGLRPDWDPGHWVLVPLVWIFLLLVCAGPVACFIRQTWLSFPILAGRSALPSVLIGRMMVGVSRFSALVVEEVGSLALLGLGIAMALAVGAREPFWPALGVLLAVSGVLCLNLVLMAVLLRWRVHPADQSREGHLRRSFLEAALWRAHLGDDDLGALSHLLILAPDPGYALARLEQIQPRRSRGASPALRVLLRHPERDVRLWAIQQMGTSGTPDSVSPATPG